MNIANTNPKDKDFYKDLDENNPNLFSEFGLIDSLFVNLCKAKADTDIRGKKVNISVIIPDKEGENYVNVNKYFHYAIRNTPRIVIGEPNLPFIIDKEDISLDILKTLEGLHPFISYNIIKQSALKLFEITSPHICYHSIASRLKVEIK
jgi:hypothetical protein